MQVALARPSSVITTGLRNICWIIKCVGYLNILGKHTTLFLRRVSNFQHWEREEGFLRVVSTIFINDVVVLTSLHHVVDLITSNEDTRRMKKTRETYALCILLVVWKLDNESFFQCRLDDDYFAYALWNIMDVYPYFNLRNEPEGTRYRVNVETTSKKHYVFTGKKELACVRKRGRTKIHNTISTLL